MAHLASIVSDGRYSTARSPFEHATDVWVLECDPHTEAPHDAANVVILDPRLGFQGQRAMPIFVPAVWQPAGVAPDEDEGWIIHPTQWAFGGRFVHSIDSRFHRFIHDRIGFAFGAVPLHDYNLGAEMRDEAIRKALWAETRTA